MTEAVSPTAPEKDSYYWSYQIVTGMMFTLKKKKNH